MNIILYILFNSKNNEIKIKFSRTDMHWVVAFSIELVA